MDLPDGPLSVALQGAPQLVNLQWIAANLVDEAGEGLQELVQNLPGHDDAERCF